MQTAYGPPLPLALAAIALAGGCREADAGYAAKGNAVCARAVAEYRALLGQADASRAAFARMLRFFDESQRLLRSGVRSFGESEEAQFLLVFGAREEDKAQALARQLGLGACAEL